MQAAVVVILKAKMALNHICMYELKYTVLFMHLSLFTNDQHIENYHTFGKLILLHQSLKFGGGLGLEVLLGEKCPLSVTLSSE